VNKIKPLPLPPARGVHFAQDLLLPAIAAITIGSLFWVFPFRLALYFAVLIGCFGLRYPLAVQAIATHHWVRSTANPRRAGSLIGTLLFLGITIHSNPVLAQIFNQAERETDSVFGQYIGSDIITFMFGLLRIVIWISAVGFGFFAIYQAQRGEQWQPLVQNAFIIIAAVVLVEGISSLFFGDGGDNTADNDG
jgi:hypothetical protein